MVKKRSLEKQPSAGTPQKDTPIDELDQKGSLMHYNAVMLEEMNSKLKLVLEFVTTLAEQVKEQFEEVNRRFEEVNRRFEEVNQRFEEVNQRFEEVNRRFEQIDKRFEQVNAQFKQVNQRLDRLEQRMDLLEIAQQGLRNDMLDMEQRICSKINRLAEGHERRFAALESRP